MSISLVTDTIYTYRFLKLLVTPFKDMEAYKLGIIDENGKRNKEKKTLNSEEQKAYTLFHRLIFNLKKLLGAVPGGKTKVASYVAALALLRENYGVDTKLVLNELNIEENEKESISTLLEVYSIEENKRIPRKKGQPANSKKHSDLYTDENPKGTIHGLKFATVDDAEASVKKIENSDRSHAHKIQAAIAMEQRARVMGKDSAANVYREYINKMKKKTKEKNETAGTTTADVAMPPTHMKFKAFLRRKKEY
tara:strand:- start:1881 stop:2633 length:753 start_codon:yes stop_codon:yes gene_type:complete